MNRLEKFSLKQKIDVRPRNPALQALEGWYDSVPALTGAALLWHERYLSSGSRMKFTRWLAQQASFDNAFLTDVGRAVQPVRFKLSCRHNDLVRLSETPHYATCLSDLDGKGRQQLRYLGDPDVALLYLPDAAGKFLWRCVVRLVTTTQPTLVTNRVYGNGPTDNILASLAQVIPVRKAVDIRDADKTGDWLLSPTVHNNPSIMVPVWTDHPLKVVNNRIAILTRRV